MRIIAFILCLLPTFAHAALHIDVTGAGAKPVPIAIPTFMGVEEAEKITQIVKDDLEKTGLFHMVSPAAFIEKFNSMEERPTFADWQVINAEALVQGEVTAVGGDLKVSFKLWDIYANSQMEAKAVTLPATEYRRLGHVVADMIYSRVTGEGGYFDSKVVYVAESGPLNKRVKRLAMMDLDGANHQYLTDGKVMALTPRFSPDTKKVTYLSYAKGAPKVHVIDLKTGVDTEVGHFPGMTFAPRFSPDGKILAMSLSIRGNSDIYLYDLGTGKQTQLTDHFAIDTSPSFSPDGRQIVFASDRSGSQQIYTMDRDGKNVKRISFNPKGGSYGTPVWSPRGDYIAFTKIYGGNFYIGLMRPDGSGERLIATEFLVEGPTWAPNGRVLMYFKQAPTSQYGMDGKTGIYSIDVTGYNERLLTTPGDASDPAWSPLLH